MRREVPLFLTAVIGLFMILSFFVPHQAVSVPADFLFQSAIIVVAFGYVLGGLNVLQVNVEGIWDAGRRAFKPGAIYRVVLVVGLLGTVAIGLLDGPGFEDRGTRFAWIYDNIYTPMSATMFALLAFYIASAAFRAFRIRTLEAGLLAAAALLVILGRVPLGNFVTGFLPEPLRLQAVQEWIMDVPQNAAKRAVLIGAALGIMATGLRVILGIERSFLGGED